jgi:hypothetical protein
MQIPPSSSLLQALSGTQTPRPTQGVRTPQQAEAARAAARAVFAQLKSPVATSAASGGNQVASAPQTQALASASPNRPTPRGSIINILV